MRIPSLLVAICASLAIAGPLAAQAPSNFPTKPLKLVVPFAPGGTADSVARLVGSALADRVGQPVVVENKPGVGGVLAADFVAKAPGDGYTLLMGDVGPNAVAAGLFPNLPYDALKDFSPVALATTVPMLLMVSPKVPAADLSELLALGRATPGSLNFASAGAGGISHLVGEMLKIQSGVDMVHVPYKNGSQALIDLKSGEVQLMFATATTGLPQVKSGNTKPMAVASSKRLDYLPDVPTMAEAGLPGFVADSWSGILVPSSTPAAVVEYLGQVLAEVLNQADVKESLTQRGFEVLAGSPAEFSDFLSREVAKWTGVIQAAGVKLE
ncbi:MAG: tripartite tricarboxylate transporter substrate binding protein [Burkholderiaceae bacterium]|nr:tripartite tricarboxylate transporter substrate binding protein [Burkholderiaceae bacterium]